MSFNKIKSSHHQHRAGINALGIYTISNLFARGISFLLIPLFTNPRYLTPEDNGLLSLFSQSLIFLMPFVSMGILHSINAEYYRLGKRELKDYVTTGFFMSAFIALISIAILFGYRDILFAKFKFPVELVLIIPVITFFSFCTELLLGLIRNNHQPKKYFLVNAAKIVIELGLAILLICFYDWGWYGRIAGVVVAYSFIVLFAFYYLIKNDYLFGKIKFNYIKQELLYAIPIILMLWSVFCTNSADNFIISHKFNGDTRNVGIYAIACTFASIIIVVCTALLQYFVPKIYEVLAHASPDYNKIKKIFIYYWGIMTVAFSGLLIVIPIAYRQFINPIYHSALDYYYYLLIGYYLWTITYFFYSFYLFYKNKVKLIILSIFNILSSLTIYYLFTEQWGVKGTAIGVCVSFGIILIFTLIINFKNLKLMFQKSKIAD